MYFYRILWDYFLFLVLSLFVILLKNFLSIKVSSLVGLKTLNLDKNYYLYLCLIQKIHMIF